MIRQSEALSRKRSFLLLRYGVIFIAGALGYIATYEVSPWPLTVLIGVALASNMYLGTVSPFLFFDASMQAVVLVMDTALISGILLLSRAGQEFFIFFFCAMLMAAKIENLALLAIVALPVSMITLFLPDVQTGFFSPMLMRVPFLMSTALFYGYVILPERTGQMIPLSSSSSKS